MEAVVTSWEILPMSPTAINLVHATAVQATRVDTRRRWRFL
jgi:hypothetical protein